MDKPNKNQKQEDEKMIAFRAPAPVIKLLDTAEFVTGKNRTELILITLKKHLPQVALDHSSEYHGKIEQSKDLLRQAKEQAAESGKSGESDSSVPSVSAVQSESRNVASKDKRNRSRSRQ